MEDFEILLHRSNIAVATVTEILNLDEATGRIIGYNSFPRTRNSQGYNRLGGGVGIYVWKDISCKVLPELTNLDHKVIWIMCEIAGLSRHFSCMMTASVYYPESAQNKRGLAFYLQTTVDTLRNRYSCPAFIIAGDFNETKKAWLASYLSLNQIVNIPTHLSGSNLNLIITNTEDLYHPSTSLGLVGLSDHYGLFLKAKVSLRKVKLSWITTRLITDSVIREYGRWIAEYNFPEVLTDVSLEKKVCVFSKKSYSK